MYFLYLKCYHLLVLPPDNVPYIFRSDINLTSFRTALSRFALSYHFVLAVLEGFSPNTFLKLPLITPSSCHTATAQYLYSCLSYVLCLINPPPPRHWQHSSSFFHPSPSGLAVPQCYAVPVHPTRNGDVGGH